MDSPAEYATSKNSSLGPLHNMTNGKQSVKHASPSWQEYTLFVTVQPGKLHDHSSRLVDAREAECGAGERGKEAREERRSDGKG